MTQQTMRQMTRGKLLIVTMTREKQTRQKLLIHCSIIVSGAYYKAPVVHDNLQVRRRGLELPVNYIHYRLLALLNSTSIKFCDFVPNRRNIKCLVPAKISHLKVIMAELQIRFKETAALQNSGTENRAKRS